MSTPLVKKELETFLNSHAPGACMSNVDEVMLSYVAEVLSGLGEEEGEETSFDVEQFSEMISAYVPEFTTVESSVVCEWVFELVDKQRQQCRNEGKEIETETADKDLSYSEAVGTCGNSSSNEPRSRDSVQGIEKRDFPSSSHPKITQAISTSEHGHFIKADQSHEGDRERVSNDVIDDDDVISDDVVLLREMFPDLSDQCLQSTHKHCGGDMERAIQKLLEVAEQEREMENKRKVMVKTCCRKELEDDKDLKELMLARYAFVDDDDEGKVTHRPVLPKTEPKKMVRYRDSRVVNTKGERYTMQTRKDMEGEEMKKTYVNLKPFKKYRFH